MLITQAQAAVGVTGLDPDVKALARAKRKADVWFSVLPGLRSKSTNQSGRSVRASPAAQGHHATSPTRIRFARFCYAYSAPVRPPLGVACSRRQPSGVPDGATATASPVTVRGDHFAGGLQVLRAAVRTARRNRATFRARRSVSILSQRCHSISSDAFTRKTRRRPAVSLACGSDPGSRCRSIPWYRAPRSREI
jgi:hypothetical protein